MPAGVIRTLHALGSLRTLGPLGSLRPLRTLELRLPLRAIGAILMPVLAAVGATVLLPYVVGAAIFLPIGTPVFLAVHAAVFLPVRLAICLPIGAAIFLADVGLRERGGGASQRERGHGD